MSKSVVKNSIELDSISHFFKSGDKKIHLFKDLSLSFEMGKTTAIVGPSGSGKSSLLTLAAGLEEPKSGAVYCRHGSKLLTTDELRNQSGFIFQHFHLLPELSALSNLALPLRLRGDTNFHEKSLKWLNHLGLQQRADHKPSQLSGGEQQRIAIARAFITQPNYIFADEPTGNLDKVTSEIISDLMFNCTKETGCGVILVTHSSQLAERADDCYRLVNGKLEHAS
ncbi:MAG: ABC transporter ATP-binding protein [Gammaproteobacteria bacterium]|nr:ABC transporter ATP-binding protein [Gammaproteobacteria bacterium]